MVRRLRRVMAVFTGLLVASTWPLWTPGTEFPDIPWFAWAVHWPPEELDWLWLASLGGLIVSQFLPQRFEGRRLTIVRGLLFAGAVMLLPTDQHRLQPWVWQMLIATLLIAASATDRAAVRSLRLLTISIYFWSAVSKLDWAFVEGLGQVLLDGLADSVGLSTPWWTPTLRHSLAALFPAGELAVAVSLLISRTRWFGMWAAIAMHGLLMLTVGPLGLGHEWGVLLWNAFFGVQVWLLFRDGAAAPNSDESVTAGFAKPPAWAGRGLTWVVCLLPALSLVGWWDWWPSWAVYSARPASVRTYANPQYSSDLAETLPIDRWSYESCWCPMYPQERYRLAVVQAVSERYDLQVWADVQSSPDRWTGERIPSQLGPAELDERLSDFWINTSPRSQ